MVQNASSQQNVKDPKQAAPAGLDRLTKAMIDFEKGKSHEAEPFDFDNLPDARKQQILGWEQVAKDYESEKDKSAVEIRDEGVNKKSSWDDVAALASDDGTDKANQANQIPGEASTQSAELTERQAVPAVEQPEAKGDAESSTEPNINSMTLAQRRQYLIAKRGAQNESQSMQNKTMAEMRHLYGDDDNLASAEFTADEQSEYDEMVRQTSKHLGDVNTINAVTGINNNQPSHPYDMRSTDASGLGGLQQDANEMASGTMAPSRNALSLEQQTIATSAGRDAAVALKADNMARVDQAMSGDITPNEAQSLDLDQASNQLETISDSQNMGANLDGVRYNMAEDKVADARQAVDAALSQANNPDNYDLAT